MQRQETKPRLSLDRARMRPSVRTSDEATRREMDAREIIETESEPESSCDCEVEEGEGNVPAVRLTASEQALQQEQERQQSMDRRARQMAQREADAANARELAVEAVLLARLAERQGEEAHVAARGAAARARQEAEREMGRGAAFRLRMVLQERQQQERERVNLAIKRYLQETRAQGGKDANRATGNLLEALRQPPPPPSSSDAED